MVWLSLCLLFTGTYVVRNLRNLGAYPYQYLLRQFWSERIEKFLSHVVLLLGSTFDVFGMRNFQASLTKTDRGDTINIRLFQIATSKQTYGIGIALYRHVLQNITGAICARAEPGNSFAR